MENEYFNEYFKEENDFYKNINAFLIDDDNPLHTGNDEEIEVYKSIFDNKCNRLDKNDKFDESDDYSMTVSGSNQQTDKCETKANSISIQSDEKIETSQIFTISKDYLKKLQILKKKVNKKELLKMKIDNTKKLLNTKRQCESIPQTIIVENSEEKKILDKKEIKKIRNRISAQKSRDKQKSELLALKKENSELKTKIEELLNLVHSCKNCNSKMEMLSTNSTNQDLSSPSISSSPKLSFSTKALSITGLICIICIINIFFFGKKDTSDSKFRNLSEQINFFEPENFTIEPIVAYENTLPSLPPSLPYENNLPSLKKPYPTLYKFNENLRQNFLFSLVTRLNNGYKKKTSLRAGSSQFERCPNFESVDFEKNSFENEYNGSKILPVDINKNYLAHLSQKVESIYCNDYIGTNLTNHNNINFEALLNRDKGEDCLYLHLVFPFDVEDGDGNVIIRGNSSDNNQRKESNTGTTRKKGYYEIGCKVFDIKKVIN